MWAYQLEQRCPEDWAPYSAPDGRTHFRHRFSGRSRWTLPAGAVPAPKGGGERGRSSRLPPRSGFSFFISRWFCGRSWAWGFSHFSPVEKCAGLGPHSGSELGADFTPWTPAAYAESMEDAYDEAVEESEAEAEVEEGAETRFAAGFRPMRVCMQFLAHQLGRPVWGVPMAIGAPSHTHGLSFTRKPQPMSSSSPRTFWTEAVVAASGPGKGGGRGVVWR